MRHGKKINHLGVKAGHRRLMLANMASSLVRHKRISTTVAKAKALRKYVEPLITKSKNNTTHSRRTVFAYLQDKASVSALFGEVASRVGDRPGGYTRIIKMNAYRLGDNADMCMMELVDFNDTYVKEPKKQAAQKAKTRRSRRGGKKASKATETQASPSSSTADKPSAKAALSSGEAPEAATDDKKAAATDAKKAVADDKKAAGDEPKAATDDKKASTDKDDK